MASTTTTITVSLIAIHSFTLSSHCFYPSPSSPRHSCPSFQLNLILILSPYRGSRDHGTANPLLVPRGI
uniref:Putative secreted protein n=1 Tax=Anopheles darlingi TaxID=43151 RepID=A0A2M4DJK7_ANODA